MLVAGAVPPRGTNLYHINGYKEVPLQFVPFRYKYVPLRVQMAHRWGGTPGVQQWYPYHRYRVVPFYNVPFERQFGTLAIHLYLNPLVQKCTPLDGTNLFLLGVPPQRRCHCNYKVAKMSLTNRKE